jgi:hypothetical protein
VVVSRTHDSTAKSDPQSIERGVRQILADKVCGAYLGMWLLVAEHLRLGTWDILLDWTAQRSERVEPRLALQLVHEAALCVAGLRAVRSLPQASFGLLQGLPFLACDTAIHQLLASHRRASAAVAVRFGAEATRPGRLQRQGADHRPASLPQS